MTSEAIEKDYKVVATRCGSCGCGCPTILESNDPDELVIVGRLDRGVLLSKTVKKHVGENEVAVVIPRSLLIEAATLTDVLSVFKPSVDAGCKLTNASVELKEEEYHHEEEHKDHAEHAAEAEAEAEEHHSEFHAAYTLECASPDKLTSIDFPYFELFAGAQELDVNLVSEKGQTKFEVTRDQPKIELGEIG